MAPRRFVATILTMMVIVLPTAHHASASAPRDHHVSLAHAPRMPSSTAPTTAVFRIDAMPVSLPMPGPALTSSTVAGVAALPLAAPFVPPRG